MTFNMRDFPKAILGPWGIVAQSPDEIMVGLLTHSRDCVISAARQQRVQLTRPTIDRNDYLDMLRERGLVQTSKILANYRDEI